MKKLFCVLSLLAFMVLGLAAPALADRDKINVFGTVQSVDTQNLTLSIKSPGGQQATIKVNNFTEFDMQIFQTKPGEDDRRSTFGEIKTGDFIDAECYAGPEPYMAKDINIYR